MSASFRVDDVLKENVNKLWMSSVSVTTRSVYYTGLQCLLNFLLLSGVIISFLNDNSMFILTLNSSKTDPFRKGVQIPYFKKSNLCPVACMLSYIHSCRKIPLQSESPLFVDNFNQPFSIHYVSERDFTQTGV